MAEQVRRKSAAVTLGITALLAAGLSGCGSDEQVTDDPDYGAVCVDQQTQQRVDDDRCDDDDYVGSPGLGLVGWYFIGRGLAAPPIGGGVSGGTYNRPAGTVLRGGLPRTGGTVTRGGFGSSARAGLSGSGSGGGGSSRSGG